MADINQVSARVIDYAERLSAMSDAAQGKRRGGGGRLTRWVVLPASGAALFAFVRSEFFTRRAKDVLDEAKTLATDLPEDLMGAVRQTTATASGSNGSQRSSGSARSSRSTSRQRKSSASKRSSAGRSKTR